MREDTRHALPATRPCPVPASPQPEARGARPPPPAPPPMEADIQQHVLEYLAFNNFTNTASCFEAELRKREAAGENAERPMEHLSPEKRKEVMVSAETRAACPDRPLATNPPSPHSAPPNGTPGQTAFLDAFDRGDHTELFTLWQRHIPPHVRNRDPVAQKLEFYLNVHCAAMPFRPSFLKRFKGRPRGVADAAARAMQVHGAAVCAACPRPRRTAPHPPLPPPPGGQRFNHFLETRGKQLAQTTEFLVYYALPYVPNPVDHPSFQVRLRAPTAPDPPRVPHPGGCAHCWPRCRSSSETPGRQTSAPASSASWTSFSRPCPCPRSTPCTRPRTACCRAGGARRRASPAPPLRRGPPPPPPAPSATTSASSARTRKARPQSGARC